MDGIIGRLKSWRVESEYDLETSRNSVDSVDHQDSETALTATLAQQTKASLLVFRQAAQFVAKASSVEELQQIVATSAAEGCRAERAVLLVLTEDKRELAFSQQGKDYKFPVITGVAGHVVRTGDGINVQNAQKDPRHNRSIDLKLGVCTMQLLAVPIFDDCNNVIGVCQVANRICLDKGVADGEATFSVQDRLMLEMCCQQIGTKLKQLQLGQRLVSMELEADRVTQQLSHLMHVINILSSECCTHDGCHQAVVNMMKCLGAEKCKNCFTSFDTFSELLLLLGCGSGTLYLVSATGQGGEVQDMGEATKELVGRMDTGAKIRIPMTSGIAGFVARTATMKNVADVYTDPDFNHSVDAKTGYRTRSCLCMPIFSAGLSLNETRKQKGAAEDGAAREDKGKDRSNKDGGQVVPNVVSPRSDESSDDDAEGLHRIDSAASLTGIDTFPTANGTQTKNGSRKDPKKQTPSKRPPSINTPDRKSKMSVATRSVQRSASKTKPSTPTRPAATKEMNQSKPKEEENKVIGVCQLLNKKNSFGQVEKFTELDEALLAAFCFYLGVNLSNIRLRKDLTVSQSLFKQLVCDMMPAHVADQLLAERKTSMSRQALIKQYMADKRRYGDRLDIVRQSNKLQRHHSSGCVIETEPANDGDASPPTPTFAGNMRLGGQGRSQSASFPGGLNQSSSDAPSVAPGGGNLGARVGSLKSNLGQQHRPGDRSAALSPLMSPVLTVSPGGRLSAGLSPMQLESRGEARSSAGSKVSESYEMIYVFFSDIVKFTDLSARIGAQNIMTLLNDLFSLMDELVEKHGLYKVETIGDAYMVASGLPFLQQKDLGHDPAVDIVNFALDATEAAHNFRSEGGETIEIRVGVHCGPAFGGVVGRKMPRFCLFGDTVSTAVLTWMRMHSLTALPI
jgi:GAF domain-containing protein